MNASADIDESRIKVVLEQKKNLLTSSDEEARRQVIQEFVDEVVILPSDDLDHYEVKVRYRVFIGGGEAPPVKSLTKELSVALKRPFHI